MGEGRSAAGILPGYLALGQFWWAVLVLVVWSAWLLVLPVDPDYTAGELLDHVTRWRESGLLYPPLGEDLPLRVLNYPPLVFALVRALAELGLPVLAAGRLVNGAAVVLLVGATAWWVRRRGISGTPLLGVVGMLGASFPVVYGAGQFHVEMLAVAATVTGFALVDRGRGWWELTLAGFALALACFAKHTQVVPAAVALAWVLVHRRGALKPVLGAFALTGLVGSLGLTLAFGPEAWRHLLVYTVGTFSLGNLGWQALSHVAPWAVLLGIAVWHGTSRGAEGRADAAWWYWCGALLWSLSAVRRGAGYPYFLDLHVATVAWIGPAIFAPMRRNSTGFLAKALPWVLAVQLIGADIGVALATGLNIDRVRRTDLHLEALCAEFDPAGPVVTEEVGLARACGRAPAIHPFITTSLATQGRWDPAPFEAALASGALGPAVLPFDPTGSVEGVHRERWTPGALAAFAGAPSVERHAAWWVVRW